MVLSTIGQLKAARALIDWTQSDLSLASGVPMSTIRRIEASTEFRCQVDTLRKIQTALEKQGLEFLNHSRPGVRLHPCLDPDA